MEEEVLKVVMLLVSKRNEMLVVLLMCVEESFSFMSESGLDDQSKS